MNVKFHPAARIELREAWQWYEERSPMAATAFAEAADVAIARIAEAPSRYPAGEYRTRRFVFERFPFIVAYQIREREIVVVAFAHQSRKPGYWRKRAS